ncbi:MAG: hypothetical protein L3J49_08080 [Desulfobulbaceae bacterium]|nr:hypothetical protein [Desulfobulbaceae bacterium]
MKKLILATIACAFIAGPALANDFAAEQAKTLGDIIVKMDQAKENPAVLDILTSKRNCVEAATNIEGLQECIAKFPSQPMDTTAKN